MFWFIPTSGGIESVISFICFILFLVTLTFPNIRKMWWDLLFAERNIDDSIEESAYIKEYQRGYDDGLHQKVSLDDDSLAYQDGLNDGQKERSILKEREDIA